MTADVVGFCLDGEREAGEATFEDLVGLRPRSGVH